MKPWLIALFAAASMIVPIEASAEHAIRASGQAMSLNGLYKLIRRLADQNSLAHCLRPMDMMRHGWLSSFRHASQQ